MLVNHLGLIVDWDCETANVYDGAAFQHIVDKVTEEGVFADPKWTGSHLTCASAKRGNGMSNHLFNAHPCLPFEASWCWAYFKTRLAFNGGV